LDQCDEVACPIEAIYNSSIAIETLLALCSEVELDRNKKLSADKYLAVIPFLKTYMYEDGHSFVVQTEPLFTGLPKPHIVETPNLTRANIGQSTTLMNPSSTPIPRLDLVDNA